MATCDLCNAPAGSTSKRYSCWDFKAVVHAGLRPPVRMFILLGGAFVGMKEAEKGWVQKVMSDSTDWVLCPGCAETADRLAAVPHDTAAKALAAGDSGGVAAGKNAQSGLLRITCRHCEKKLRVKAMAAGKRLKCPHCQLAVVIPHEQAPAPESAAAPTQAIAAKTLPETTSVASTDPGGSAAKLAFALLYSLTSATLFSASFVWLEFHWFWAACFALLASAWLTFGVKMPFTERRYPDRTIARWIRNETPSETVVTELSNADGDVAAVGVALMVALSILCFQLVPWEPGSVLGYLGWLSLCLLPPLAVGGAYIGALEQAFGKRQDRVLEALRNSKHPTCVAATDLWEERQEEAEEAKRQGEAKRRAGRDGGSGPAALANLFNSMDAKGAENFAKLLNQQASPAHARARLIMEPVLDSARLDALLGNASTDFLNGLSKMSDAQLRTIAESFNKMSPEALRAMAADFREPPPQPPTTAESLGRAAVVFRLGYFVARLFVG